MPPRPLSASDRRRRRAELAEEWRAEPGLVFRNRKFFWRLRIGPYGRRRFQLLRLSLLTDVGASWGLIVHTSAASDETLWQLRRGNRWLFRWGAVSVIR